MIYYAVYGGIRSRVVYRDLTGAERAVQAAAQIATVGLDLITVPYEDAIKDLENLNKAKDPGDPNDLVHALFPSSQGQ